jgi:uncharacterized protein (DUF1330 family)
MAAYILVEIAVHDAPGFERYRETVVPSIVAYGGRFIVRGAKIETLEGDWKPERLAILEFPDRESARAWWESPEYADPKALRLATASSRMILVDGA